MREKIEEERKGRRKKGEWGRKIGEGKTDKPEMSANIMTPYDLIVSGMELLGERYTIMSGICDTSCSNTSLDSITDLVLDSLEELEWKRIT